MRRLSPLRSPSAKENAVVSDNNHGRVAIVTGAGHGIGRGIAAAFAASGASVVVADRDIERAEAVAAALDVRDGAVALPAEVDVRSHTLVEAMVERAVAELGGIDVLINNAGVYPNSPVVEMSEDEWDAVFDTNVKGMFLVSRAVARRMIARGKGGRIVNISSGAAESGRVGAAHYCASKAAVNMFTKVLALELAPHDIMVNAVGPGLIDVPDWNLNQQYIDAIVNANPLRRMGTPEDIAHAVLYLASPGTTYTTGSILYVDGGSLAGRPLPYSGK
jgi:NAD(P)-dependent dehydrogenase (short-subunit alcohol dehydrogenase family)